MQTEHLFELTYILLEKKSVTAGVMAEHFGVSKRTIYRWVDALNLAGVPVITTKGKGGGISLSEKYSLDKAVLTEDEKLEILSSVQALEVLSGNSSAAVSKLKAITKSNAAVTHEEEVSTDSKNVFSDYDEPVESLETVRLQVKDSSMFMILDEYADEKIEDCPPCSLFVWTFQTCKIMNDFCIYLYGVSPSENGRSRQIYFSLKYRQIKSSILFFECFLKIFKTPCVSACLKM